MSDASAQARATRNRTRLAAIQEEKTRPTRCIVVGRYRILGRSKGEEVLLPADVANRNMKRGFVRIVSDLEDTQPLPVLFLGDEDLAEEAADYGPSVPKWKKG